jgi:hypothetical protein
MGQVVQGEPFSVHPTGGGLEMPPLPRKPNDVEAPGASVPLWLRFRAVTNALDCVTLAFQLLVIRCPFVNEKVSVHPFTGVLLVFVTVTLPVKLADAELELTV